MHGVGRICTSLIVFASLIIFGAVPARAENITVKVGVGDTTVTVSGRTSPSAFVTLLSNGTIIGTTTANMPEISATPSPHFRQA